MKPLLSAIRLGKLELKNGFIVAPMTTYSSQPNGIISDDEIPYLARRAKGGFAAIMTAACYVHPSGRAFPGQWGCDSDDKLESLKRVAEAIQANGAKAILQIHHGGRQCPPELAGGECLSASAIPAKDGAPTPREMTDAEIERTLDDFAQAALRAKQAGYDGVEIHGANTYLIQQFVSPHSNRRTDRWKADSFLFPTQLVEYVLNAVGSDFPVGYRFSPEEPETPGIRLETTFQLIDRLCNYPLSFLHVSLRDFRQHSIHGQGEDSVLVQIKKHIDCRTPLIGVGSVKQAEDADAAHAAGCDAIAIARGALYDAEWVQHYANGQPIVETLNRESFAEEATLPAGLAKRLLNVPGWLNFAD